MPTSPIQTLHVYLTQCLERRMFPTLVITPNTTETPSANSPNPFLLALILSCLMEGDLHGHEAQAKRLADILRKEIAPGSVNYWPRDSEEHRRTRYPDDLDVTSCVLAALHAHDPANVGTDVWAKVVNILTLQEEKEGGPYRTWLISLEDTESSWHEVDPVVNANVAFMLSTCGIRLEPLDAYLHETATLDIPSSYYPTPFARGYFLARAAEGTPIAATLRETLEARKEHLETPLDDALYVNALLRLGAPAESLVEEKARLEAAVLNGSAMQSYPLWIERITGTQVFSSGAPELTAALCLEALERLARVSEKQHSAPPSVLAEQGQTYTSLVLSLAHARLKQAGPHLFKASLPAFQRVTHRSLSPFTTTFACDIAASFRVPHPLAAADILQLDLATLYGWNAYTIYDDVLDGEPDPERLSVANLCLRELTTIFETLLPDPSFSAYIRRTMDLVDETNAWEVSCARHAIGNPPTLPAYGAHEALAHRSWGAILAPQALLFAAGFGETSKEVTAMETFFLHFFIARQLNDDLHDWEEDLNTGQLTSVNARLLREAPEEIQIYPTRPSSLEHLRRDFWRRVVPEVYREISQHIKKAEAALEELSPILDPALFLGWLRSVADAVEKTRTEQEETLAFLAAYAQT